MGIKVKHDRLDWCAPCPLCETNVWQDNEIRPNKWEEHRYKCPGCGNTLHRGISEDRLHIHNPVDEYEIIYGPVGDVTEREVSPVMFAIRSVMLLYLHLKDYRNNKKAEKKKTFWELWKKGKEREAERLRKSYKERNQ